MWCVKEVMVRLGEKSVCLMLLSSVSNVGKEVNIPAHTLLHPQHTTANLVEDEDERQ